MKLTNKDVAALFYELGKLMELHGESPFKTRAYDNAYRIIRGYSVDVLDLTPDELLEIQGIGKAIADKIKSLADTGTIDTLENYRDKTPVGIREMLRIKGLGPKKIKQLWVELGIESVGELLYACLENRLVDLKGFGQKTQEDIAGKAQYFMDSSGFYHYTTISPVAVQLVSYLQSEFPGSFVEITGALRRQSPITQYISLITDIEREKLSHSLDEVENSPSNDGSIIGNYSGYPVRCFFTSKNKKGTDWWKTTSDNGFSSMYLGVEDEALPVCETEEALLNQFQKPYVIPLRREIELLSFPEHLIKTDLVSRNDIKGIIHAHTTYSDGAEDMSTMAEYCRKNGFSYLVVTDHSKSAIYADGLNEAELLKQWAEIDQLNQQWLDFKIFKGIESDILYNGQLDYEEHLLKGFECIIASIHSVLKMDIDRATTRLITAIENPYTHILGHPTGRLLLSREGYPIDHKKVIDSAAANGVAIEINANPYRLDLDWTWIPYAVQKGVKLSINPDAHNLKGIFDIDWGIPVANKGGVDKEQLLCCLNQTEFEVFLKSKPN